MDNATVFHSLGLDVDATAYRLGAPQQSGPMVVLPVFGPDLGAAGRFAPPLSGLKLGGVKRGYGNVVLTHTPAADAGVAIVPLHMGYIQDGAQNHALCRSAFVGAGQQVLFEDACCVQQAQGGFLEGREQWFLVLPLSLREEALALRGQKHYGKLWPAIARLSVRLGAEQRGHLEQVIGRQRAYLTQFQSRFELLEGQTGAIFFLRDRVVGVELAPTAEYFREVWMPLVCFCYGTAAMELERKAAGAPAPAMAPAPFEAGSLAELRQCLSDSRWERQRRIREPLARAGPDRFRKQDGERYLGLRLYTAGGARMVGQVVEDGGRLVYASLVARSNQLRELDLN